MKCQQNLVKTLEAYSVILLFMLLIPLLANAGRTVDFLQRYFHYQKYWESGKISVLKNVRHADFAERIVRSHRFYLIDVGKGKIELSEKQLDALETGKVYQIYYWDYEGDFIRLLSISSEA
jgi:hypothetical protein